MDDVNAPIFSQAKSEYTKQLIDLLYMNLYDGIRSMYDDAKLLYIKKRTPITKVFRSLLEQVPKWNAEIIDSETNRIEKTSKCDWLDDLLTAVFISHTRILMSIGSNHNFNKINVTIPKTTTFIHKSYINIAREVWKNPYLFDEQVPGHEYQRNMKQLEDMIKSSIEDTIRRQLPIKEILREHLENTNEPKQNAQLDMKTLVDEIRKAGLQNNHKVTDTYEQDMSDNENDTDYTEPTRMETDIPSMFVKEEEEEGEEKGEGEDTMNSVDARHEPDQLSIQPDADTDPQPVTYNTDPEDPGDPGDPDESQIQKATQNIVLNDITEPVVEQSYDNVDLVSPTKSGNTPEKESSDKLSSLIKELSMDAPSKYSDKSTPIVKIDKLGSSTSTSSASTPSASTSSTPNTPVIQSTVIKSNETLTPTTKNTVTGTSPFSFDNLYPQNTDSSNVDEPKVTIPTEVNDAPKVIVPTKVAVPTIVIKDKGEPTTPPSPTAPTTNTTIKDMNAAVMKEVISLDKSSEQIDDTKSLDVFFNDIQKIADPTMNPMAPIKEETKYTLFEDAPATEG